jgi:exoribonuclease II
MITTGKLIEYLDNGKFICALVTENQPKRVRLINHNKREVNLPVSRIIHCSDSSHATNASRDLLVKNLQDTNNNRHALMTEINLEEIWELTCDETVRTYDPAFLAELVFGKEANDDLVSALLRCIFVNKLYFKYKEGKIIAHPPEKVELLRIQAEKEAQKREAIQQGAAILKEIHSENTCDFDKLKEFNQFEKCIALIRDYYLFGNDAKEASMAKEILKEAGLHTPHAPFHILVKCGIWDKNQNIPLLRQEIPVSFSLAARQQAELILQNGIEELFNDPHRVDYTHLKPITIDGATTLDFDDALSLEKDGENFLVGIHISDVAHYVKPGDALFQEAMNRGTSIYFPENQVPMLPRHLSQGICSLIQGELRAAVSFMILLSPEAEVLRVRIKPSIIKVARRLTYDEADQLMDHDPELTVLKKLRKKLRSKRLEAGALLLPFPDVNIYITPNGTPNISLGATDTPARTLVSEMMILANSEAARYVSDRIAPGLFRSQAPPKKYIVNGEENDLFLNTLQRKQLSRGELLTTAKKHSGLGVNQYTTVTSPIRRLLDLVMQHQIHSIVRREPLRFNDEMCKDFISVLSRTLSKANNVKQQRHRYWMLKYLEEHKSQFHDALVIDSGPKRVGLILVDILFDFDLPTPSGSKPTPGSIVKVRIAKVDALDNLIRFQW